VGKSSTYNKATSVVFTKPPKVIKRPIGERSPNLVTLRFDVKTLQRIATLTQHPGGIRKPPSCPWSWCDATKPRNPGVTCDAINVDCLDYICTDYLLTADKSMHSKDLHKILIFFPCSEARTRLIQFKPTGVSNCKYDFSISLKIPPCRSSLTWHLNISTF
jgi:hypothetical protein